MAESEDCESVSTCMHRKRDQCVSPKKSTCYTAVHSYSRVQRCLDGCIRNRGGSQWLIQRSSVNLHAQNKRGQCLPHSSAHQVAFEMTHSC
jgi:hypothetical protein